MSDHAGGDPAPYGGSASAPIGAPTPGPADEWEAVVDEDVNEADEAQGGEHARNATDNPELADNVKGNREADAEDAGNRDYSTSSAEGENEAEQDADTPERDN